MLKLISYLFQKKARKNIVSIHPMLKLIYNAPLQKKRRICFNTSHVKVNPKLVMRSVCRHDSFNTSHVKVNQKVILSKKVKILVSIHPMLKLIKLKLFYQTEQSSFNTSHVKVNLIGRLYMPVSTTSFNTSHVKVNHCCRLCPLCCVYVSIHPMLKLIKALNRTVDKCQVSIHPMLKLIGNTLHACRRYRKFQYIPC